MTEREVHRVIYFAITECLDDNGQSFVQHVDTARQLSTAVLQALRSTELVRVEEDGY
jgi:hypothetical protein